MTNLDIAISLVIKIGYAMTLSIEKSNYYDKSRYNDDFSAERALS